MKKLITAAFIVLISGCSNVNNNSNNTNGLTNPVDDSNLVIYKKTTVEFDIESNPEADSKFILRAADYGTTVTVISSTPQSTSGSIRLLSGNLIALAVPFTLSATSSVTDASFTLARSGTNSGNAIVKIVKDASGSPSTLAGDIIGTSNPILVSTIPLTPASPAQTDFTFPTTLSIPTGNYWVVITGDSTYLAGATVSSAFGPTDALGSPLTITDDAYVVSNGFWSGYPPTTGYAINNTVTTQTTATNCTHGQCVDYTDITVVDVTNTQFSLTQGGTILSPTATNNNLGTILNLTISSLFDNDLFACSSAKCTSALVRIYTTNVNAGSGLYNPIDNQTIPLYITSPLNVTPTMIPYLQTNALVLDQATILSSQQVVSLANGDFTSDNFPITANFQPAGAGTYKAHIVVEYDLATSNGIFR